MELYYRLKSLSLKFGKILMTVGRNIKSVRDERERGRERFQIFLNRSVRRLLRRRNAREGTTVTTPERREGTNAGNERREGTANGTTVPTPERREGTNGERERLFPLAERGTGTTVTRA